MDGYGVRAFGILLMMVLLGLALPLHAVEEEEALPALLAKVQPAVVTILVYDTDGEEFAQGSGFFIKKFMNGRLQRYLVTNRHVMEEAASAKCKAHDGKLYEIRGVVADSADADLVLLDADVPNGAVATLSLSTAAPKVGSKVFVVGSPLGLDLSVSDGIVAAVRTVPDGGTTYQITAPVSHGSSGSPVINLDGKVLGVATYILSDGQNLNFATPAEYIQKMKPGKAQTLDAWAAALPTKDMTVEDEMMLEGHRLALDEKYDKAVACYRQALKENPKNAKAWMCVGCCYDLQEKYPEAIRAYQQAITADPKELRAYYYLGLLYRTLGQTKEAEGIFRQALDIDTNDALAHLGLGALRIDQELYAEAVAELLKAVKADPENADSWYYLAEAYESLENYDKAISACEKVLALDEEYADAHILLAYIYNEQENYVAAEAEARKALKIDDQSEFAYVNLGVALFWQSDNTAAIRAFKRAIAINAASAHAHLMLGFAHLATGNKEGALDECRALKKLGETGVASTLYSAIVDYTKQPK